MVFGWIKKKQSEADFVKKEASIDLDKVDDILKEQKYLKEKQTIAEAQKFRKNVLPHLDNLRKVVSKLEKDDLKLDDVDKHVRINVNRGKKQVVSIIKREASRDIPEVSSYDDSKSLEETLGQILKRIGEVLGRQSRILHSFAKKYVDKLKESVSDLEANVNQVKRIIEDYETFENNHNNSSELLSSIHDKEKSISNSKSMIDELDKKLNDKKEEIAKLEDEIKKIKESSEYQKFLDTKKELDKKATERNSIRKTIQDQITLISRPLSKYRNATRVEEHELVILDKLIQDPYDALKSSDEDPLIVLLGKIRKGVETNLVSVKDIEKTISNIDKTIEKISDFQKRISVFEKDKSKLEKKLAEFDVKSLETKKRQLANLIEKQNELEAKIQDKEKETSKNKEDIPNLISDLEINLQHLTGIKYQITHHLKN